MVGMAKRIALTLLALGMAGCSKGQDSAKFPGHPMLGDLLEWDGHKWMGVEVGCPTGIGNVHQYTAINKSLAWMPMQPCPDQRTCEICTLPKTFSVTPQIGMGVNAAPCHPGIIIDMDPADPYHVALAPWDPPVRDVGSVAGLLNHKNVWREILQGGRPTDALGADGDFYFDMSTMTTFRKKNGQWQSEWDPKTPSQKEKP